MPRFVLRFFALALMMVILPLTAIAQTQNNKLLRVLFVGNSYTYENNLPFVFEALARPVRNVQVTMVAEGGATLRRHIDHGILKKIAERQYDVVVLQEQSTLGPSRISNGLSLLHKPTDFYKAVHQIAPVARTGGARLILFATWPRAETPYYLAALHNAYVNVAKQVDATVAPVGMVWDRLGGDTCESLHLYGPDGAHPAPEGTYIAAVVLIRAILGKTPPLNAVSHVPLMDGTGHPSGSYVDIAPTDTGKAVIVQAVDAVYKMAHGKQFPSLPDIPSPPEPTLPSPLVRGRITPSFLQRQWQGTFADFRLVDEATLMLDLRTESAKIQMIHVQEGWPGEDKTTAKVDGPSADGLITLTYASKGKNCTVEIKLARVGNHLQGLVRFISEDGQAWVRSTVTLTPK